MMHHWPEKLCYFYSNVFIFFVFSYVSIYIYIYIVIISWLLCDHLYSRNRWQTFRQRYVDDFRPFISYWFFIHFWERSQTFPTTYEILERNGLYRMRERDITLLWKKYIYVVYVLCVWYERVEKNISDFICLFFFSLSLFDLTVPPTPAPRSESPVQWDSTTSAKNNRRERIGKNRVFNSNRPTKAIWAHPIPSLISQAFFLLASYSLSLSLLSPLLSTRLIKLFFSLYSKQLLILLLTGIHKI